MADLLVPLYNLPSRQCFPDFTVRRSMAHEGSVIRSWIEVRFSSGWASEVLPAVSSTPSSIVVAIENSTGKLAGFCGWDCTALGFLGPVGVLEEHRGSGLGRAVCIEVFHCMRERGYGYAVVGGAGPVDFFQSICDAWLIPGSTPGIYPDAIK